MKKLLLVSMSFLVASLVCSAALAQAHDTTKAFTLEVEGVKGTWFPSELARKTLAQIEELRELRVTADAQDSLILNKNERLSIKDQRILQVQEALVLAETGEARMVSVVTAAVRGQREAEEARDAWHRSPTLWFSAGAAMVIALELGALVILGSR